MTYDLVVSGCIAASSAGLLAREYREELLKRYAPAYIDRAINRQSTVLKCPGINDAVLVREIGEGGINAALWETAEELKCGLRIELYDIPVFQDTIEICNTLDKDPYILDSKGVYLIYTECGMSAVRRLRAEGFEDAAVIGHTSSDKKRLIIYGEVERFLTRSGKDTSSLHS
ncbi:MAG: hypothetical protein J6X66_14175 [Lachnospiraceae bacterium]|nr:hypothetical protein [Lachnospiraceae bacterium]